MPRYVVCIPATDGSASVAPCADVDGVAHYPSVVELPAPGQVHFGNSQTLFEYGFINVLVIWLVGLSIGAVLNLIRSRT